MRLEEGGWGPVRAVVQTVVPVTIAIFLAVGVVIMVAQVVKAAAVLLIVAWLLAALLLLLASAIASIFLGVLVLAALVVFGFAHALDWASQRNPLARFLIITLIFPLATETDAVMDLLVLFPRSFLAYTTPALSYLNLYFERDPDVRKADALQTLCWILSVYDFGLLSEAWFTAIWLRALVWTTKEGPQFQRYYVDGLHSLCLPQVTPAHRTALATALQEALGVRPSALSSSIWAQRLQYIYLRCIVEVRGRLEPADWDWIRQAFVQASRALRKRPVEVVDGRSLLWLIAYSWGWNGHGSEPPPGLASALGSHAILGLCLDNCGPGDELFFLSWNLSPAELHSWATLGLFDAMAAVDVELWPRGSEALLDKIRHSSFALRLLAAHAGILPQPTDAPLPFSRGLAPNQDPCSLTDTILLWLD